jgi:MFS family permease
VEWIGKVLGSGYDPVRFPDEAIPYRNAVSCTYIVAGVASLLLAAFSLTLPHTPPKPARGGETFAWLEAMKMLNRPFLLVLFIATFIDAAVHQGYFVMTGSFLINKVDIPSQWVMPVMTIGQIAEILTMALLGMVLKQFGWRTTMIFGILGHAARFAVFAFFPEPAPAILINVMHGICYAFFFATVYIFVDEFFPKDARASAQGLFNFLILGLGPFVGNLVWPSLESAFKVDGQVQYQTLFLIPAGTALAAAILLALFFHPPQHRKMMVFEESDEVPPDVPAGEGQIAAGYPDVE